MNVLVARRLRCAACDSTVDISTALSWRCPHAVNGDRHHVLRIESDSLDEPFAPDISDNPFVMFRRLLAWDSFAASHGASDAERREFIEVVDAHVASVAGVGFRVTPFARHSALSDALQFSTRGGVWVKDETHGVGGSHKARHLFTELLHLLFAESRGLAPWGAQRPELAIASCGNAAIAASTLAAAAGWPIRVFVPESSDAHVLSTLRTLNALVEVCPRLATDPAGDPCVLRFRERVATGAIPFGVQGPENAWCLDGGRVIGWEMLNQLGAFNDSTGDNALHRMFIQVGGGAFAAGVGDALISTMNESTRNVTTRLHAVQTAGCSPLNRAWERAASTGGTLHAGSRWDECMWPWETEPQSLADGILDDETYDWVGVCDAMSATGGSPVVSPESDVVAAYALAHRATNIDVSPTGSAGLAGVLTLQSQGVLSNDERIGVVFSGIRRGVDLP